MLHEGVRIAVERDGRVLVAENFGERLYIHAAFDGTGGERVPQGMETLVRDI